MATKLEQSLDSPRNRLIRTASDLFYREGYNATGINEIIQRSLTSKKSFYRYFPSKRHLGLAYIRSERDALFSFFERLSRRRRDFAKFAETWAFSVKKAATCEGYNGCPFSNLAAQASGEFKAPLRETMEVWRTGLADYLGICDLGLASEQARELSDLILMHYQGAVQMWRLTGDTKFFDRFLERILALADEYRTRGRQ